MSRLRSRDTVLVKAVPVVAAPRHEPGRCEGCRRPLDATFSAVRGRDTPLDDDAFFTDRFCSRGCYHAYGLVVASPAAAAAWN